MGFSDSPSHRKQLQHKMKMKSKKSKDETLEDFLARIEELNEGIAAITENVNKLKTLNNKILNEPSQTERQKQVGEQGALIQENKSLSKKLQKSLKEEKKKLSSTPAELRNNEFNIKKTQVQTVSQRFLDIWTEYNNIQVEFRGKNKKALLRNLKIVDPNSSITVEEIEDKLDRGDVTVLSSIIKETSQAKEDLKMIENRHAEFLKLEKGITEIHEMFMDLSYMVSEQGETIDRIETHVTAAAQQVESGRDQLQKAEKHKKSARRMKFILAAILAGVATVLIILLAIFL